MYFEGHDVAQLDRAFGSYRLYGVTEEMRVRVPTAVLLATSAGASAHHHHRPPPPQFPKIFPGRSVQVSPLVVADLNSTIFLVIGL